MKPASASSKQAVILCGGLGTRLRPLTDNLPKPMAPVNGKPFLFYLLQQLSEQGVTRFVLLTGYLGECISEYFKDGSAWNWSIEYSKGPAEWDTGRRIWEARELLDGQFLLLYSDNFVQFNLSRLQQFHEEQGGLISLHLAPKDKGNIRVSTTGKIEAYDKSRSGHDFNFVEVGYMLIEKKGVLDSFPLQAGFPDFNFSAVLEMCAKQSCLAGIVVHDPYHSISDIRRLELMCEYLKPKKILLVDRDGTMNQKAPRGEYIAKWDQFQWISFAREALIQLAVEGFSFIVITNQAGIARKMIDPVDLEEIHQKLIDELKSVGVNVLKVYMCPHHWDENSFMRKPAPGMFFQAAKEFNLRLDHTLYVGDDERDCEAAINAGCGMVYISEDNEMNAVLNDKYFLQTSTMLGAVNYIIDTYKSWESPA
jgi:D-glycero-D-manno-heptose 1,7-bisphosphate phosphatase